MEYSSDEDTGMTGSSSDHKRERRKSIDSGRGHHSHRSPEKDREKPREKDERRKSVDKEKRKSIDYDWNLVGSPPQIARLVEYRAGPGQEQQFGGAQYIPQPARPQYNVPPQPEQYESQRQAAQQPMQMTPTVPQQIQMVLPGHQQILVTPVPQAAEPDSMLQQFKALPQPVQYISVQPVLVPNHRHRTHRTSNDMENGRENPQLGRYPKSDTSYRRRSTGGESGQGANSEDWQSTEYVPPRNHDRRQSYDESHRYSSNRGRRPSEGQNDDYLRDSRRSTNRRSFEYSYNPQSDRSPRNSSGGRTDDSNWRDRKEVPNARNDLSQEAYFGPGKWYDQETGRNRSQRRSSFQYNDNSLQGKGPYGQSYGPSQGQRNRNTDEDGPRSFPQSNGYGYNEPRNWEDVRERRRMSAGPNWTQDFTYNQINDGPFYASQTSPNFPNGSRQEQFLFQGSNRPTEVWAINPAQGFEQGRNQGFQPNMNQGTGFSKPYSDQPLSSNLQGYPEVQMVRPSPSPGYRTSQGFNPNQTTSRGYYPYFQGPNQNPVYNDSRGNSNLNQQFPPFQDPYTKPAQGCVPIQNLQTSFNQYQGQTPQFQTVPLANDGRSTIPQSTIDSSVTRQNVQGQAQSISPNQPVDSYNSSPTTQETSSLQSGNP